jgi:hypothetical protein
MNLLDGFPMVGKPSFQNREFVVVFGNWDPASFSESKSMGVTDEDGRRKRDGRRRIAEGQGCMEGSAAGEEKCGAH